MEDTVTLLSETFRHPNSASLVHDPLTWHKRCDRCVDDRHSACSDPTTRTRSPRRVETVCCCREHRVMEVRSGG